jgi:hypothetical protein
MVKISNLRSLQEEGYKIELPHAIPADEDIESKKIYLYIEGVAPNQVVKFAAKDHAGNVQRIIIKDEDLSKVAPYVRNALNDPTKTDIKQLAFSAQSAIANVIMHHGYGPEPKAGTVISGHDTPVFRAPEEPDLTVTTKAPTK